MADRCWLEGASDIISGQKMRVSVYTIDLAILIKPLSNYSNCTLRDDCDDEFHLINALPTFWPIGCLTLGYYYIPLRASHNSAFTTLSPGWSSNHMKPNDGSSIELRESWRPPNVSHLDPSQVLLGAEILIVTRRPWNHFSVELSSCWMKFGRYWHDWEYSIKNLYKATTVGTMQLIEAESPCAVSVASANGLSMWTNSVNVLISCVDMMRSNCDHSLGRDSPVFACQCDTALSW